MNSLNEFRRQPYRTRSDSALAMHAIHFIEDVLGMGGDLFDQLQDAGQAIALETGWHHQNWTCLSITAIG